MIVDDLSQQTKTEIYLNLIIFNLERKYSSRSVWQIHIRIKQYSNDTETDRNVEEKEFFFPGHDKKKQV